MKFLIISTVFLLSIAFAEQKIELPEAPPPVPKKSNSHLSVKDNSKEIREDDEQLQRDKTRPKNLYPGNDATEPSIPKRTPQVEFSFSK
ncbi:MAG: hypothetical protein ACOCP1_02435 [Campylobacterales bacterium]